MIVYGGDRILYRKAVGITTANQPNKSVQFVHAVRSYLDGQARTVLTTRHRQVSERTKRYVVHSAFLVLMVGVALYGRSSAGADRTTLLYALVSGAEEHQGPLDKSAYAQTNTGIGGPRLAGAEAGAVDNITFEDLEVGADVTALGGTAVVAPMTPIAAEPGSEGTTDPTQPATTSHQPSLYAVAAGDTIASIAAQFNVSTNTILWANGLGTGDTIKAGDHLTIPPTTGVLHKIKSGDTISEIASTYDVKVSDIMDYNGLDANSRLTIGKQLMIPDGQMPALKTSPVSRHLAAGDSEPAPVNPAPAAAGVANDGGWVWPTTSHDISQYFKWGHTGVDIDKNKGEPVFAARSGTVEFTGWLGGYGNLTIVNHGGGLQTYYAHQSQFKVNPGQKVTAGQAIGVVGTTGHSTGYHLHFEVRKNGQPTNPMAVF